MRLIPPLPPPATLLLCSLLALSASLPAVLSQSMDDPVNSSAAAFLSLPASVHTAVSVLVRLFSTVSLLFSSFVVAAFFVVPRLRLEYNARFVLLLAFSDMLHSGLLLLGPLSMASSPSSLLFEASASSASPSGWCSAHSSLLLYASLVSLSWTSVIAINHFLVVYHSASILQLRRYQLAQHLTAWLLPLLPVLLALLLPSSSAALASPLCWLGMADARLAYPSSAWLLLLPQLLSCTLLSGCYMLALRYGLRLTRQLVASKPESGTQTKESSQMAAAAGAGTFTACRKGSTAVAAQTDRAVLSDKYRQMKRKVSLYLFCAFLLAFPLLLSSLSLLPSAPLPAGYLSVLFLLQAVVGSSQGLLHSVVYGWNTRLFYHLCPPASHPPLLASLLRTFRLPPPPPALSPATSPPFTRASRVHPSALGQPATSPYLGSRAVSTVGRASWRASSVMMAQAGGGSGRMAGRRVDGGVSGGGGAGGGDEDDTGSPGSVHVTPVLTHSMLLSPPSADAAEMRLFHMSPDASTDSASPRISRNTPSSLAIHGGGRRFSVTPTIANLPAVAMEGGSFSAHHHQSNTPSPIHSAQCDHLQPLTSFSSSSNPQSALPWIPSLSLPPHHGLALPALATPGGLAPLRPLRTGSSFSSSSRASVSFLSPTHMSSLSTSTPRSEAGGGAGEVGDGAGGGALRVTVSGWDGGGGLTARRGSQEEMKELATLNEEDERDGDESCTPAVVTAPQQWLSSHAASPTAAPNEQSRGSVILTFRTVASPTAGSHSPLSPSASNSVTPLSSYRPLSMHYSLSLASLGGRASLSTPSSARSSPHLTARSMAAGYSPRPTTPFDRRPLRVNPAPPTTAAMAASPCAGAVPESREGEALAVQVQAGLEAAGIKRPKLATRLSLPLTIERLPVELRTGVSANPRLSLRRQSEPAVAP